MRLPFASMMRALSRSADSNVSPGSIHCGSTTMLFASPPGLAADLQRHLLADLVAERADRRERRIARRQDLIAGEQPGAGRRHVGEHGGDESLAVDVLGEHADAGVAHLVAAEVLGDVPAQRIGEDVDQLVVGRLVRRVVVRVRCAELGEQRVDGLGALGIRLGGGVGEAMLLAHRLPVEALHLRVVELVARDAPSFLVDGGGLGLGLVGARLGERQHLRAGDGDGHGSGADESRRTHVMTSRWRTDVSNVGIEMDYARTNCRPVPLGRLTNQQSLNIDVMHSHVSCMLRRTFSRAPTS